MKIRLFLSALVLTMGLSVTAIAQTQQEHEEHHPPGSPAQTQAAPPAPSPAPPLTAQVPSTPVQPQMPMDMGQMMQRMPEHCRGMMQNMPENCVSIMQQMTRSHMGGTMPGIQAEPTTGSAATKAYMEAAERMHGPMMESLQASDPDVAFAQGTILHHQSAIGMAKVVLQYGKDDQVKKLANDVIREQEREISEMQEWLKKNAR